MGKKYIIELPDDVKQVAWPMKDTGDIKVKYVGDLKSLPSYVVSAARESYNEGANDAWNLTKKLLNGYITYNEMQEIFDTTYVGVILDKYSPIEVAEKIAEYKKQREISYKDCSDAMLKMWMDGVLTDGEYSRIMDKLNAKHKEKNNESTEEY